MQGRYLCNALTERPKKHGCGYVNLAGRKKRRKKKVEVSPEMKRND